MKARIRKTGEIVEIISYSGNTNRNDVLDSVSYIDSKGVEHPREKLNFYWDFEVIQEESKRLYCQPEVNWRQVEIQAAIGAMQVILTSRINYDKPSEIAYQAANYASALVRELKERELKKGGNV